MSRVTRLAVVPIYVSEHAELVRGLLPRLERLLPAEGELVTPWFDPERAFDPSRGQYHSTRLLADLLDDPVATYDRVLGVTSVDLFIPVLTYVFGEAQLDGRAAAVSLHRLRPEVYGLPVDDSLLADRLLKESLHELGHTYGLLHCLEPDCVMHSSTYVEDIDLKSAAFCGACRARLLGR